MLRNYRNRLHDSQNDLAIKPKSRNNVSFVQISVRYF